jgi:nitrogen regulatory protein PII
MKKITAYVNGLRVQHLMQELQALGIREVRVTEYTSSLPKISFVRFLCEDGEVDRVQSTIDQIGATGTACDHCFRVTDADSGARTILP